ncbi:hypothetical protein DM02DRAFT_264079 [Periconia macrospinosa]|uniref:Uncharacterized protein n=1 Tax=Periconia macrospinosa TaxID=97972 RepID=A0A2V1E0J4_9PLEO|nr:hypothetical protein DM02DRAFT_264079 [Periconia macrospinosa]
MGGPPYAPKTWALGGRPSKAVDIPITAVLLLLFIVGAVTHMTILQLNRKRGHKFLFNGVIFGFCMARTTTCVLRIASISRPNNIRLAIAAQIFVAAGVILLWIVNLLWSQRILRSTHPQLGWHMGLSLAFKFLYVLIALTLIIVITATVQSFYTLRPDIRSIDRSLQLYGSTCFAIISFLPIPILILSFALPRKQQRLEKFGYGSHRTKCAVLFVGTILLCLGAAFRAGTSWKTPVPQTQPLPSYFHKACFYIFNFVVEIMVVYMYAAMRADLRFWVPNGAKGPGSYATLGAITTSARETEMGIRQEPSSDSITVCAQEGQDLVNREKGDNGKKERK